MVNKPCPGNTSINIPASNNTSPIIFLRIKTIIRITGGYFTGFFV